MVLQKQSVSYLRNRHSLDWPREEGSIKAEKAALLLLTDVQYLSQRAGTLIMRVRIGYSGPGQ